MGGVGVFVEEDKGSETSEFSILNDGFYPFVPQWPVYMRKLILLVFLLAPLFAACRSSILDDPSTVIPYSLQEPSHVTITIENSYNTVVATLVDADQNAGPHNASYNVSGLQEGIYFYTMDVRSLKTGVQTRATHFMILIK